MYLDTCKVRSGNKVYSSVLMREFYREDGKVKHRTIANLSKCSDQEIAAIRLALQHKHDLAAFRENALYFPRKNGHVILGFLYCVIEGSGDSVPPTPGDFSPWTCSGRLRPSGRVRP